MKNRYLILLLGTIILISGCKSVIKKTYGIKNPKFETIQTTSDYLVKNRMDSETLWVTRDFDSYKTLFNTTEPRLSLPDVYFFNSKGKFLDYRSSPESCNANLDMFINDISDIIHTSEGGTLSIDHFLGNIYAKNLQEVKLNPEVDGYAVISWSIFMGNKLNKEKAFDWVSLIKKLNDEGLVIQYFLLNMDPQKSWGLTLAQEEELLENFKVQ